MKIQLIQVGKTDENYLNEGIEKYFKRINHYISFETITIAAIKKAKNLKADDFKTKEAAEIMKKISNDNFVILLDEKGRQFRSKEFADFLQQKLNQGLKTLSFVIGGAYGFHKSIYERANFSLSLSSMTFSHQLIRLIFAEQLYRAFTILKNEPYHNE